MTSTALALAEPTPTSGIESVNLAGWHGALSPHTARAYSADFKQFDNWLTRLGGDWRDVTPGVITTWLTDLKSGAATGRPLATATRGRKLTSVLSFYRFARAEGWTTVDPAPFKPPQVKRDGADIDSLDPKQTTAVWTGTADRPRLRALVAVSLFCGLRVSEAVGLQLDDIEQQQGERVLRVMGKGSKPRTVVLPAPAVAAIEEWLAVRGRHPGPLFVTTKAGAATDTGSALDVRAAHREIRALGERVGITGLHPHALRHTYAVTAVDAGVDVLVLATTMGHASVTTTMIYVKGRQVISKTPAHTIAAAILGNGTDAR
jgi:integrase/recombinase XerD